MEKRGWRATCIALDLLALFLLGCRVSPGLARAVLNRFSRPVMKALHRVTAAAPFPVVEPLALVLAAMLAFALISGILHAIAERSPKPLYPPLMGMGWTALLLGGLLLTLWMPAREAADFEAPPVPQTAQLKWLCEELIDALNASPSVFPSAEAALRAAPAVAGLPGCAVKAARYPEWMRAAGISGLFVPLTGEALVDAGAPAPLVPFTAVHELTHLTGIADEGAANIAAWERCMTAGGGFQASARLWALRYAMGLLRRADEDAWLKARAKMEGALARVFQECGGETLSLDPVSPGLFCLSLSCGDYAALVGHLAAASPR